MSPMFADAHAAAEHSPLEDPDWDLVRLLAMLV